MLIEFIALVLKKGDEYIKLISEKMIYYFMANNTVYLVENNI